MTFLLTVLSLNIVVVRAAHLHYTNNNNNTDIYQVSESPNDTKCMLNSQLC